MRKINQNIGRFLGILMAATVLLSAGQSRAAETAIPQLTERLFEAVTANNLAVVRSSITAGANITAVNQDGMTAAGLAIEKGYFNIAHYILGVRNQKSLSEENSSNASIPELPKNPKAPTVRTEPQAMRPATAPPTALPRQAINQWPANKPNPFAPDANSKSMPIIGKLQAPGIQPALPQRSVMPQIKEQTPSVAPLRNTAQPAPREIQAPTPLKPLTKEIAKESGDLSRPEKTKGVLDRMVNGVTDVFKSEEPPKTELKSTKNSNAEPTKPVAVQKEDDEDGVMGRMWNSITGLF